MSDKLHILFLAAWYPYRDDAMYGLFVRKHAIAASRFARVTVLYLKDDEKISSVEVEEQETDGINEVYVYYPSGASLLTYSRLFDKYYHYITSRYGRVDLCHANVFGKNALMAYRLWKAEHIPYVVTEHWTGYTAENFQFRGFWRKHITALVARNAKRIMPVSQHLARQMQRLGLNGHYKVVNNVVDDFFYTGERHAYEPSCIKLLHISCFDDAAKNISGLLRAVAQLRLQRQDFELTLIGTGRDYDKCRALAHRLQMDSYVRFTGELTPQQVAQEMKHHDALVMFSNFENSPVVISEALAVGIPTVSTNVGGISEMIGEQEGVLIDAGNEQQLTAALGNLCDNYTKYDSEVIRRRGLLYSFSAVGQQLNNIYMSAM